MYHRIIRNDILKSKMITFITIMFVAVAAMLVSLVAVLTTNLVGSIDTLMAQSKTPHFTQMHSGSINNVRLESFAGKHSNVDQFQVLEFLNIDGTQIIIGENSFKENVQDNGFSIQSEKFDYLLDLDGNAITVSDGEIYVPISYMKNGIGKIGDKAVIYGKKFIVSGFLRDSQMNSLLASSKRFLISENDYYKIKEFGKPEYLIEFRLKDLSKLTEFETSYISAGLEANGPTLTYPLFKILNGISDGIMIAIILLVSILVVTIAFMCIRFTLLAKIEEDYSEIGVMKAIGLRVSDIKKIYLAKYVAISAVGCILGFTLSFVFRGMLLENIRLYMGESKNSSFALVFSIVGILLVFLAIITYVNKVLKRFKKISATEAIQFGTSQGKFARADYFCLSGNKILNTNIFLGIKDVLTRKKLYFTMLMVIVISTFIIIVPQNLYNTISSKGFSTYMGIGKCDIRIDIQQTDNILKKSEEIRKVMESDSSISQYALLTTKMFKTKMSDGSEQLIKIELGDHSVFPIEYTEGIAPISEDEIALSFINANELSKKIGDVITIIIDGKEKNLTVSGIYSDITNGGKTAKAVFTDNSDDIMWCIIAAELSDKSIINSKVLEYGNRFDFGKISNIDEYIKQTFGSTISAVGKASVAGIIIALLISLLVTLLFMKMLLAKDRYSIAVMKALGFTNSDVKIQYVSRSVLVLTVGIIFGIFLSNTLGELLAGMLISKFGASSFKFEVNQLYAYLLCPLMMVCSVLIGTIMGTSSTGQIKISENIKE